MSYVETPDGVRLRLCDRGRGGGTFVLVHGWKQSHRLFDPAIAGLAEPHRVTAYDQRGMGESDKPRSRYDFDELAGDLGFVLNVLDLEDVTLVGWSMGCTVSLAYMSSGGARVARLVLMNGPLRLTPAPGFPFGLDPERLDGYIGDLARNWPLNERAFAAESLLEPNTERVDWLAGAALETQLDVALKLVREQARLDLRGGPRAARRPRTRRLRPARALVAAQARRLDRRARAARRARDLRAQRALPTARGGRALLRRHRGLRRPHEPAPPIDTREEGVPNERLPAALADRSRAGDRTRDHVVPDRRVNLVPNVGIVLGDDAVLVVDTGMGPANGRLSLEAARRLGGDRRLFLTLTHFHPEHGFGAQSFADEATMSTTVRRQRSSRRTGASSSRCSASWDRRSRSSSPTSRWSSPTDVQRDET